VRWISALATSSFIYMHEWIRTALHLKSFLATPLVPESDQSISSCSCNHITWRVVGAFEACYFCVCVSDDAGCG
jgi:hypothetical protein